MDYDCNYDHTLVLIPPTGLQKYHPVISDLKKFCGFKWVSDRSSFLVRDTPT